MAFAIFGLMLLLPAIVAGACTFAWKADLSRPLLFALAGTVVLYGVQLSLPYIAGHLHLFGKPEPASIQTTAGYILPLLGLILALACGYSGILWLLSRLPWLAK